MDFLEINHRRLSKFIPDERNMRSWWKHDKKLLNTGEIKEDRVDLFEEMLEVGEKFRRVNQCTRHAWLIFSSCPAPTGHHIPSLPA